LLICSPNWGVVELPHAGEQVVGLGFDAERFL
jgi:hypothetical protein